MKDGIVLKRELKLQKDCKFDDLYNWQWKGRTDRPDFILHDGPPYANGDTHVGHALNKILKDITNRYKVLRGYRVTYKPGWDCHGLPIELKAVTSHSDQLTTVQIREKAEKFARETIKKQKRSFREWGVMADWGNGCYYTYDKQYEAKQLEVFYEMYAKEKLYRGFMPVYWSPSSRTALAEAELEYNDGHVSPSVYLKLKVTHLPDSIQQHIGSQRCHVIIWTTTPWTLLSNEAICYGQDITYSLVMADSECYIVCEEFVEQLKQILNVDLKVVHSFKGSELSSATYEHPTRAEYRDVKMFSAEHVTTDKGTGLVHTAPAHGQDDFKVALAHDISINCIVNGEGCFTEEAGPQLMGKHVINEGNEIVLKQLSSMIVERRDFTHSYPYDWRTKLPVIVRASKQWFVNTGQIKDAALDSLIADVTITPSTSGAGMITQLQRRPYWCISRQRVWGVPIPVFYHKEDDTALISRQSIDHLKSLVNKHGTSCWWSLPLSELLPDSVIAQSGHKGTHEDYVKGEDILDIWFDSGTSWACVLEGSELIEWLRSFRTHTHTKNEKKVADVYLEGLDQFGGWFQSSLLTSVATRGYAPYRNIVVHGFTIDENGAKMSKSVGNVVDPRVVIHGDRKVEGKPSYGVDVLRWWASLSNLDPRVLIGDLILFKCNEQVFKIRKSLRFIMGNLSDFNVDKDALSFNDLLIQDRYILHSLHSLCEQVTDAYDKFNYTRAMHNVDKFINVSLSLHSHITKDRLYCDPLTSKRRRSAQTVQHHVLIALVTQLAPVLPHLGEEINQYYQLNTENETLFRGNEWFVPDEHWSCEETKFSIEAALEVRNSLHDKLGSDVPLTYDVIINASRDLYDLLKVLEKNDTLLELFQCSTIEVLLLQGKHEHVISIQDDLYFEVEYTKTTKLECLRCRRMTILKENSLCDRCSDILSV